MRTEYRYTKKYPGILGIAGGILLYTVTACVPIRDYPLLSRELSSCSQAVAFGSEKASYRNLFEFWQEEYQEPEQRLSPVKSNSPVGK